MSDVRVDFKSDSSQVNKNITKIKSGLGGISGLASTVGAALKTSFIAIGAAAAAASTAFIAGSKDIIDYGGELDDLSSKTGISIQELVLLQEAFKFAGISADTVSKAVLGLNNKLANPSDKLIGVLDNLGLSLNDLNNLSVGEKFTVVGEAIGNLSDTSERAAVSSALFGRNLGQGLLPLFNNKNALKEAAVSVGSLGENMQKYAPAFAKIGDAVDSITTKFRQLFAEALGKNADKLVALADKLLAVDLGAAGTGLGNVLSQLLSVMEGKTLKQSIIDGIAEATPILVNAFIKVADIIVAGVSKAMLGGEVTIQKTWDDLVFGFKTLKEASGPTGPYTLLDIVPAAKRVAATEAEMDRLDESISKIAADRAGANKKMGLIVLDDGDKVALLGFTESILNASKELTASLGKLSIEELPVFKNMQEVISGSEAKIMKPLEGGAVPLSDLQRVGGAKIFSGVGATNPMVEQQKKTNKTLMDIYNEQKRKSNIPLNFLASFA